MNISPINLIKLGNISKHQKIKNFQLKNLNFDTVSFSSNYLKSNQRIDEAVNLGYEIYFNSIKKSGFDSKKFLARKEKDVQIISSDKLKEEKPDGSNYCAYFSSEYDENIEPTDMKLYIGEKPKTYSLMPNLLHSMEIAHEYTHCIQTKDGSDSEFLKELSKGDKEYLLLLNGLGGAVFSIFDNHIQARFASQALDKVDALSVFQYGSVAPREKDIDKEYLLNKNGFNNQEEFNQVFNGLFDEIYDKVFDNLNYNSPNVEKRVKDAFASYLAKDGSLIQLKKDVRKYCAFSAQIEQEAYTTESKLAKKVLQTDKSLNIDVFPIYYSMLSSALSH